MASYLQRATANYITFLSNTRLVIGVFFLGETGTNMFEKNDVLLKNLKQQGFSLNTALERIL